MNIIAKRLKDQRFYRSVLSSMRAFSSEGFMSGNNIAYIEQMYESWQADPKSVHTSWATYFNNLKQGVTPAFVEPPVIVTGQPMTPISVKANPKDVEDHLKVLQLVSAYQLKGHEIADFDPLSIKKC